MQNMEPLAEILNHVRDCRRIAMQMAKDFRQRGFQSQTKPDQTFVTEADMAIERELRRHIEDRFPHHQILGEEEGASGSCDLTKGVWWILDPIDGTFSFVNGVPFYSSLIAVLIEGTPVIGSACLPELGWVLEGVRGQGASFNDKPLTHFSKRSQNRSEILGIADPYRFRMTGKGPVVDALLSEPFKTRVYPDALGYMLLATGAIQGFVDPKTEIWDTAPFRVILPEIGGHMVSWEGDERLSRGAVYSFPGPDPDPRVLGILQA